MQEKKKAAQTIDEYIAGFPADIQQKLQDLRKTIRNAAPQAVEKISYQIPAFDYKGILVYFAAYADHVSFFPTGSGREAFARELAGYKGGKGTVRIPLDQPLPLELITKIVEFRVAENIRRTEAKMKSS